MGVVHYSDVMESASDPSVPKDVVHRIHHKFWTYLLFWSIVIGSIIAVPGYGFIYGYSWLDWTMFAVLYVVTGLGITVGYHRLLTHRSFECPDWIKACLLIAGGWRFKTRGQNGRPTTYVTMRTAMTRLTPTMPNGDFGTATAGGFSTPCPVMTRDSAPG